MKKNIKIIIGVILLVILSVMFTQSNKTEQSAQKDGPVQIGHLGILSGPAALFGEAQLDALNLAAEEINANGGINGRALELVVEDYAYDSKQAIPAYQTLKLKGLDYYLQDGSNGAAVLGSLYAQDKVINIAPSATTEAYFDDSELTCRLAITADTYALKIVDHIESEFGRDANIAFLVVSNEYGQGVVSGVGKEAELRGMNIIDTQRFDAATTDFRTQATKLVAQQDQIDILITINVSSSVSTMFQQLQELGYENTMLSDNWTILNPALTDRSLVEGVTFIDYEVNAEDAATQSEAAKNFVNTYKERYGKYPNTFAVNGYDALNLYAQAIAATNDDGPQAVADYFINEMGTYVGVSGSISFDRSCEVQRNLTIREIIDGGIVSVK